jgi:hypothetical protein
VAAPIRGYFFRPSLVTLRDLQQLDELTADYELYESIVAGKSEWREGSQRAAVVESLRKEIDQLKLKFETEKDTYLQRRKAIDSLMDKVAKRLPGFTWGVFDDSKPHPLNMGPMHSTAASWKPWLETLRACWIVRTPRVLHPGFLLHDSPREAEMSEPVFWALLSIVSNYDGSSFQYIVTTTTKALSEFKPFVRLVLNTKDDGGMLFRKRIGAESKPLAV